MVPFAGWHMPVQYTGITDEHLAVRNAAGLFDVSHMGELLLTGDHAASVVNYLITNDATRLQDGEALYTLLCNDQGVILDDLLVYRLAPTRWLIICNASNLAKVAAHVGRACENHCEFQDISASSALLALQGPRAAEILAQLEGGATATELSGFQCLETNLLGLAVVVGRTGYTGEDGFEIVCPWNEAPRLWKALLDHGAAAGIRPVGLGARDTLRLEARLSLYGNEIDETTDPFEAGLGWVVKLDRGDFMGREALIERQKHGSGRTLVGFEMVGRGIARHGYPLLNDQAATVGICTSGSPSPALGTSIGLGYVPTHMAAVGTPLLVDCRGRNIAAKIVKTPFYKRPRAR